MKNRRYEKKRAMSVVLAAVLAAGLLAGCGGNKSETNKAGEQAKDAEYVTTYGEKMFDNVTITVELFDRSNAPDGNTLTDNRWVEYVNQEMNKVGINVEFVGVPRADEVTKMQTMMSSGTAPDIVTTYTYAYAEDYWNQGGIWDLSDFIEGEGQAKNLKAYLGQDVLNVGKNADNNLYGIVAKRPTLAASNLFIRQDWLGLEVPETPDELFEVLTRFVNDNPDQRKDVVGASFWTLFNPSNSVCYRNTMSAAFTKLGQNEKKRLIANGIEYYYDEGIRDYFRFINKCYDAGLMDKEYYTETKDSLTSDIVNGALGFCEYDISYNVRVTNNLVKTLKENNKDAEFVSIPSLKNINDGKQYSATYSPGGLIAFCPKTADAETVEACMTYLDWLCSKEGGYVIINGFEDEHYTLDSNGLPKVIDSEYNAKDKDWLCNDLFILGNSAYASTSDEFHETTASKNVGYENYVLNNYKNSLSGELLVPDSYSAPSESERKTDLDLVCSEWLVKCITCAPEEFDGMYDTFKKECENAGIEKIVEERTEHYNKIYGDSQS